MLRISVNSAVESPTALAVYDLPDFDALHQNILESISVGGKTDSDLLVPVAEWWELNRIDANAKTMSRVFCGDVDAKTDAEIALLKELLQGLSYILYTTHSHRQPRKGGLNCYRLILELDREYDPAHHLVFWDRIQDGLQGLLDKDTRRTTLGYYLPSHAPGTPPNEVIRGLGEPLAAPTDPVAAAAGERLPSAPCEPVHNPISVAALEGALAAWTRQARDVERREVARAARALLKGKCTIELGQGRRNGFLISLAGYLASQFPEATDIEDIFSGIGWDLFNADGKYPLTHFGDMISRCQAKEAEAAAERRAAAEAERAKTILRATGGERDFVITPEEVSGLVKVFGDCWEQHALASFKRDLYLLRPDGTYDPDPVMREQLFCAARDRFAVFGDYIEYMYEGTSGLKQKTAAAFIDEYATVARRVVYDMTRPKGGYDVKTETVFLPAAAPLVEPVEHPEIHRWFELLGEHLIDMVACMPKLGEMLPVLVLTGRGSTGKTLLAKGIGQIYGSDVGDAEETVDQHYNAALLTRQPIVLMDEKTSTKYRKEGTTFVRKFVTQGTRHLDEKWQARVELIGYPRLIVAANNHDVLNTDQDMSSEDREAFQERLVHIDMDPGFGYIQRTGKPHISKNWLGKRWLAEHVFYLSQNWIVRNPGKRFLVANNYTRLHGSLSSKAGVAEDVSCWLLHYLNNPEKTKHLPIQYNGEKGWFRVNAEALTRGWNFYLEGHRPPRPGQISRAIKSLSKRGRQKIHITSGGQAKTYNAHEIDPEELRNANDNHMIVENFDKLFPPQVQNENDF